MAGVTDPTYATKIHHSADGMVVESGGDLTLLPGATFTGSAAVTAEALKTSLRTGIIQLPLSAMRLVAANDVDVVANTGGVPAKNTVPILERVNAATDKALRLKWASSQSIEIILGQFAYPPDLDDTAAVTVKFRALMGGATDTPTVAIGYFEGIGDANAGGNSAAMTATLATYSVIIAASNVGPVPTFAVVTLTPGAHTTDTFELYAAWVEYTRV